jgi:hypothetical protein
LDCWLRIFIVHVVRQAPPALSQRSRFDLMFAGLGQLGEHSGQVVHIRITVADKKYARAFLGRMIAAARFCGATD